MQIQRMNYNISRWQVRDVKTIVSQPFGAVNKPNIMKLQDFTPLCWITTEMMIAEIDAKDRSLIIVDQDNQYLIDMDVTFFELFLKSNNVLMKEKTERHFMYEWPVTLVEPVSFQVWLNETPEKEVARQFSNYLLTIGYKNMTTELERALETNKLSES